MRLNAARIAPLAEADMAPELLALLGPRFKAIPVLNIFRTLAHAPKAFKRFLAWGGYILSVAISKARSLSVHSGAMGPVLMRAISVSVRPQSKPMRTCCAHS